LGLTVHVEFTLLEHCAQQDDPKQTSSQHYDLIHAPTYSPCC